MMGEKKGSNNKLRHEKKGGKKKQTKKIESLPVALESPAGTHRFNMLPFSWASILFFGSL